MGKGKKKANKGKKKRGGKKTRDDVDSPDEGESPTLQFTLTREHVERARLAASNRTEDPLKNWTRVLNEECPICMLPLPLNEYETNYCVTCGKTICAGCVASVGIAHMRDSGDANAAVEKAMTCPYCRSDIRNIDYKYGLEQEMKRANAGIGEAMFHVGTFYFDGLLGLLQQDKAEGLKWYHRAMEAGNGLAAFCIGRCYGNGDCVDQDIDKALEYFQKAAELGHIPAFSLSGDLLMQKGEIDEGMLNYRKAVMCGMSEDYLFDMLRGLGFKEGFITKDEYAFTLREHHDARNEMKSDARESWRDRE